jgi:hypothetical protein
MWTVQVYIQDPDNAASRFFIAEAPGLVKPTEPGYHDYSYDGGVDLNAEPPPDGTYELVGEARDAAGNRVRVVRQLTIEEGGKPRADVSAARSTGWTRMGASRCARWATSSASPPSSKTKAPCRSAPAAPGPARNIALARTTTRSGRCAGRAKLAAAGWRWRFGINFDTTGVDFPYRWAVGRQEDLEKRIIDGASSGI